MSLSLNQEFKYVPNYFHQDYQSLRNHSNQKHKVLVAIMDTGIDPGSYGLSKCPDGSPKIIDVIDCTGSDDITVSLIDNHKTYSYVLDNLDLIKQKINSDNFSNNITNNDILDKCKFYSGIRSLSSYISKREYDHFEKEAQQVVDNVVLKILVCVYKDFKYCIIDHDDLKPKTIITEYHINQEYGSIPLRSDLRLNYAFHLYDNVDDNSKICSLVFDSGSHGTHVAGIVGAYYGNDSEMNGINPNVQLLSLKIGDSRVNGMETSMALIRALHEVAKYDCHLINYSFGEPISSENPDYGKFIKLLNEYSYKHNITFVTSAGNSGPNITTTGAPSAVCDRTITIGAYTNQKFLNDIYNLSENSFIEGTYQWSSRGPNNISSMGVDLIAPGCALTSHPTWNKSSIKMCNGTSMASPNATGFISLILSQCSSPKDYPHTYYLKKYLHETCSEIENLEKISQGHGLIGQKYISPLKVLFNMNYGYYYDFVINGDSNKRGYFSFSINDDENKNEYEHFTMTIQIKKINDKLDLHLFKQELRIDYSDFNSEITGPSNVIIHNDMLPLRFKFKKCPNISGYIKFINNSNDDIMLEIPVNHIAGKQLDTDNMMNIKVNTKPGQIHRQYIYPKTPTLKLEYNTQNDKNIFTDLIQLVSNTRYDNRSDDHIYQYDKTESKIKVFKVIPNILTEITFYTPWSYTYGINAIINMTCLKTPSITLNKNIYTPNENVEVIFNNNGLIGEHKYNLTIDEVVTIYQPISAKLDKLDNRYQDDNKPVKRLRLEYKINPHSECEYQIDSHNKVYDSLMYMSGCIIGMYHERNVFFGNYVPKSVNQLVDKIYVDYYDSDETLLSKLTNTCLKATRKSNIKISQEYKLKNGKNIVKIPEYNIKNIYNGDYAICRLLGCEIIVIHHNKLNINTSKDNIKDEMKNEIEQYMKDFNNVKYFLTRISENKLNLLDNNDYDPFDEAIRFNSIGQCYINPETATTTDYQKLLNRPLEEKTKLEYIGTLLNDYDLYEFDKIGLMDNDNDNDNDRLKKRVKLTYDHLKEQSLLKTTPYNVIELGNIITNDKQNEKIEEKLEIVKKLEDDINYWKNCKIEDLNNIRSEMINNLNENDKKRNLKRKYELISKTNEKPF